MVFSLYFFLSWLMLYLLVFIKGVSPFKHLSFLFLISLLIHNHLYILIPENWKGFTISNKVELYLAFLLYKTILVPSSLVIIYKETRKKLYSFKLLAFTSLIYATSMSLIDLISCYLKVFQYVWWNFYWSFFYFGALSFLSLFLLFMFSRLEGTKKYDY
jgi:hypothetical protein